MAAPLPPWGRAACFSILQQLYSRIMSLPGLFAVVGAIYWLTKRNRARRVGHSSTMSPDTVSSLFPDRPIRPLPKRRLRERLSPEVADSIKYPPSLHQAPAPLIHYPPYTVREERSPPRFPPSNLASASGRFDGSRPYTPRRGSSGIRPGDEIEIPSRSSRVTRASPEILNRLQTRSDQSSRPVFGPPPPLSAASSVDGYESFENTSNKKKRKIPSAADSALNFAHGLVADIDAQSLDSTALSVDDLIDERYYHNTPGYYVSPTLGSSAQGMSGSGRGRLGRVRSGRSPLRSLPDGNNSWTTRASKNSTPLWASQDHEGGGIISSAIAKAEKYPSQGQENVSLLQQHSTSTKGVVGTAQFTFTCDSRVPGSLQWPTPGHPLKHNVGPNYSTSGLDGDSHGDYHHRDTSSKAASRGSAAPRPRTRRHIDKELARAAYERRAEATRKFEANPPKPEDIWVCEFCEYERIFGEPPRALIRAYEKKDRLLRQEAADRKRLLEKAKAKARKGKRNSKAAAKANASSNQTPASNEHDLPPPAPIGDEEHEYHAEHNERIPIPPTDRIPTVKWRGPANWRGGGDGTPRPTAGSSTGLQT